MPDEEDKKSDPVEDLRAGLGLLFRAARGAAQKIPTHRIEELVKEGTDKVGKAFHKLPSDKVEEVVKESAAEVGRAFGHLAQALGKGFEDLTGAGKDEPQPKDADKDAPGAPKKDAGEE